MTPDYCYDKQILSQKSSNLWLKLSTFALNFTYTYTIEGSNAPKNAPCHPLLYTPNLHFIILIQPDVARCRNNKLWIILLWYDKLDTNFTKIVV